MIIKCSVGKGMNEGINYYSKDKKTKKETELRKLIGKSPYILGEDSREIERECIDLLDENDKLDKYVFRAMFSVQESEKMSSDQWRELTYDYCKEYGFDLNNHQFLLYEHNDTNNQHVHLIINRKPVLGNKTINDSFYKIKSQKIIPKLIEKYCLKSNPEVVKTNANSSFSPERETKLVFVKETCNYYLNQIKSWNNSLVGDNKIDIYAFSQILKMNDIELVIKKSNEEKIVGVTFVYENERFSGQQAGFKAERLLKKIQQVRDKSYKNNKLLNDSLRGVLFAFKMSNDEKDKGLFVLKNKLREAGFLFERHKSNEFKLSENENNQLIDVKKNHVNTNTANYKKDGESDFANETFKFNFQSYDFNDLTDDLVIDLLNCEILGNERLNADKVMDKKDDVKLDDIFENDVSAKYDRGLDLGLGRDSDNSSGRKFKAMDEEEEKEKERKSKKNRGAKI